MSAYMISSVIERSTKRSPDRPSYREKSIGLPILMRILCGFHILEPIGFALSVSNMATGMTWTRDSRTMRARPVLPLYSLPSGERVPSG